MYRLLPFIFKGFQVMRCSIKNVNPILIVMKTAWCETGGIYEVKDSVVLERLNESLFWAAFPEEAHTFFVLPHNIKT